MTNLTLPESYDASNPDNRKGATGIIEIIIKDKHGNLVDHRVEKNIIKIHAKEMLSHSLPANEVWDPDANSGSGGWVQADFNLDEEYNIRYMIFGAAYDDDHIPTVNDSRYYVLDTVTGVYAPIRLSPGAAYGGGLINSIPIDEPTRPLKRIENIRFNSTYQPAGSPLIDAEVRSVGNVLVVETVLRPDEYNGFTDSSGSDFFNITEVALIGGKKFDAVPYCGLSPEQLFLDGNAGTGGEESIACVANGTNVITIDLSETDVNFVKIGDQVKIVNSGGSSTSHTELNQLNPFYQVIGKLSGGRDIELDRVPVDSDGDPLIGNIGAFKNTLKIFSHRILSQPARKSSNFEITVRWTIYFS